MIATLLAPRCVDHPILTAQFTLPELLGKIEKDKDDDQQVKT